MTEIMSRPLPLYNLTVASTYQNLSQGQASSRSVLELLQKCVRVETWSQSVHEPFPLLEEKHGQELV